MQAILYAVAMSGILEDEEASLPDIRFHDLRHSAATLLLSEGVQPKVMQEMLGHNTISITMDVYSRLLPGTMRNVESNLSARPNRR